MVDRKLLFDVIKEELLNHTSLEDEEAEEVADVISERLVEEELLDSATEDNPVW
jgi:hypothetical protein